MIRSYGPADDDWTATHAPAADTQATCVKAAVGRKRNVCQSITVMLCATASAPTAVQVTVSLIDGVSGGTAYLWRAHLSLPAVAGASTGITLGPGLSIIGSQNTAMTLEFSAKGGSNTVESVAMTGDLL
jgi:hypothetical protein